MGDNKCTVSSPPIINGIKFNILQRNTAYYISIISNNEGVLRFLFIILLSLLKEVLAKYSRKTLSQKEG